MGSSPSPSRVCLRHCHLVEGRRAQTSCLGLCWVSESFVTRKECCILHFKVSVQRSRVLRKRPLIGTYSRPIILLLFMHICKTLTRDSFLMRVWKRKGHLMPPKRKGRGWWRSWSHCLYNPRYGRPPRVTSYSIKILLANKRLKVWWFTGNSSHTILVMIGNHNFLLSAQCDISKYYLHEYTWDPSRCLHFIWCRRRLRYSYAKIGLALDGMVVLLIYSSTESQRRITNSSDLHQDDDDDVRALACPRSWQL